MAFNPLVPQGALNRLLQSLTVIDSPDLNVSASFLAEEGITLAFEGEASAYLPTTTGAVPSPNPFQIATATVHILKTQGLSNAWKAQMELNAVIGDLSITGDAATLDDYYLSNCTIKGVNELNFAGKTPEYVIVFQGTYFINGGLFTS